MDACRAALQRARTSSSLSLMGASAGGSSGSAAALILQRAQHRLLRRTRTEGVQRRGRAQRPVGTAACLWQWALQPGPSCARGTLPVSPDLVEEATAVDGHLTLEHARAILLLLC